MSESKIQKKMQAHNNRMESLIGTNQTKLTRIYLAYEAKLPETNPNIKNDIFALSKVAKHHTDYELFRQFKVQNAKFVFRS